MAIQPASWLLLSATLAVAQAPDGEANRSHVPVPSLGGDQDPMKLFQKRWQYANALKELRKQHPNLLTPEKVKELAKQFKNIDLKDPKVRSQLEALLRKQNPKMKLTPEQIEALERLVKEAFPESGKSPWGELPPGVEPKPMPSDPPEEKGGPAPAEDRPEPNSPEERERQAEAQAQAEAARQLTQLARGLQRVAGNLNDSPTLKQTFQDLGAMALRHAGERPNGSTSQLNAQLAQLNRLGNQGGGWFEKNWPHLRSMDLPRLSAPRLPSVPWRRPALPEMPASVGAVGTNAGFWKAMLTAVLVVSLIVALAKLLGRWTIWRRKAAGDDWKLGPWPVSPAAVRTRADLIRTFEYLSLLRLGRQTRTWNHRAISRHLVGDQSSERLAATQLADLYEQARYAPAEEPLSEETLETYRRDLCLLAGVAAS